MNSAYKSLNELLVNMFNNILIIEEKALITREFNNISINDIHIIEMIGIREGRSMSSVAKDLDITVGTLTIAINNLVKKGYVNRNRSTKDRRVVLLSLTSQGIKVYKHHERFHKEMVENILKVLGEEEVNIFTSALTEINTYLKNKYM